MKKYVLLKHKDGFRDEWHDLGEEDIEKWEEDGSIEDGDILIDLHRSVVWVGRKTGISLERYDYRESEGN